MAAPVRPTMTKDEDLILRFDTMEAKITEILGLVREIAAMLRSPSLRHVSSAASPASRPRGRAPGGSPGQAKVIDLMEALKRSLARHKGETA